MTYKRNLEVVFVPIARSPLGSGHAGNVLCNGTWFIANCECGWTSRLHEGEEGARQSLRVHQLPDLDDAA